MPRTRRYGVGRRLSKPSPASGRHSSAKLVGSGTTRLTGSGPRVACSGGTVPRSSSTNTSKKLWMRNSCPTGVMLTVPPDVLLVLHPDIDRRTKQRSAEIKEIDLG